MTDLTRHTPVSDLPVRLTPVKPFREGLPPTPKASQWSPIVPAVSTDLTSIANAGIHRLRSMSSGAKENIDTLSQKGSQGPRSPRSYETPTSHTQQSTAAAALEGLMPAMGVGPC